MVFTIIIMTESFKFNIWKRLVTFWFHHCGNRNVQLFYHYHHSSDRNNNDEVMDFDQVFHIATVPSYAFLPPEDFSATKDVWQKMIKFRSTNQHFIKVYFFREGVCYNLLLMLPIFSKQMTDILMMQKSAIQPPLLIVLCERMLSY